MGSFRDLMDDAVEALDNNDQARCLLLLWEIDRQWCNEDQSKVLRYIAAQVMTPIGPNGLSADFGIGLRHSLVVFGMMGAVKFENDCACPWDY